MSFTPFFIMRGAIPAGIPAKNPLHGGCRIDRFGCPETQIAHTSSKVGKIFATEMLLQ